MLGCVLSPSEGSGVAYLTWVLTVKPTQITSGDRFGADFEGLAVFTPGVLNTGQNLLGGFRRVAVVDLKATVQVRKGAMATGPEPVLTLAPIPRTCTYDDNGNTGPDAGSEFPPCSQENDNEDRSNEDCTGLGGEPNPLNRCLQFIEIPTSDDCTETGVCAELGETGPDGACENGFCVDEALEISLEADSSNYIADTSGSVLFGWADQGIALLDVGPNRGAYDPMAMRRNFGEGIARSGVDMLIKGVPTALECIMGVNSRGPDGVLISCPIQEPE
jgi:hypothetical protein